MLITQAENNMFDKLSDLIDDLLKTDKSFEIYKNSKNARIILQKIKVEAQNLREKILEINKEKK